MKELISATGPVYFSKYTLVLQPCGEWSPPEHIGSMLRGAFGRWLRRLACAKPGAACGTCPHQPGCAYAMIFESPVPAWSERLRKYRAVPKPFVLTDVETQSRAERAFDNQVRFGFVLIGRATEYFPACLLAFKEAAANGLGADRKEFRLVRAYSNSAGMATRSMRSIRPRSCPRTRYR